MKISRNGVEIIVSDHGHFVEIHGPMAKILDLLEDAVIGCAGERGEGWEEIRKLIKAEVPSCCET
jgi:hypothetical protein